MAERKDWQALAGIIVLLILALLMWGCSSSRQVEYIYSERHTVDTIQNVVVRIDSVHVKDSTVIQARNDTVWVDRWRTKYTSKAVHDTLYVSRADTIPQVVTVEVEKKLSAKDKAFLYSGRVLLPAVGLCLLGLAGFFVVKKFT